ncbi:hypothetical protein PDIG_17070 [Penicillium digitatum PHI26]|uniref:DUF7702 domain-containing protein n=1 Tax=Penicillium digitatum (strain PHI26 / CECT 20796) TaxID=1170229 RepID=K9G7U1_PEND2|nr:hypothetical protein PDIG_17070 [Penicillium digitatum PHI26]
MLGSHSNLSIAQIVFYIPVTVTALYLACYRHKRPRMAWIILTFFSISKYTTKVSVVDSLCHLSQCWHVSLDRCNFGLYSNHVSNSTNIYGSCLMHCRVALERNMSRQIRHCLFLSRFLFIVGIGLTVAGGVLEGSDTTGDVLIGFKLVKAGYIIVVVFVACLLAVQVYFWTQRSCLSVTSRTILNSTALATPFIAVRIVYLFLSVFQPSDLRWSDLRGPIAPFLTMGLLMEYSVVLIYLVTGFLIPSWRNVEKPEILLDDAAR